MAAKFPPISNGVPISIGVFRKKIKDRLTSVFACSIIEVASLHLVRTTSKAQGVRIIEEDGPLDI